MDLKLEHGNFVPGPTGLPETVDGLAELLQNARLRMALKRGAFPYARDWGSGLWEWDASEEHAEERALALANEALLELPGVWAASARITKRGAAFTVVTPLGEGEVEIGEL